MTSAKSWCPALATLIFLSVANPVAADPVDRNECEKVKRQIRELQTRMRNGYTAAQGIRYDERMRKLKEKRYKVCR